MRQRVKGNVLITLLCCLALLAIAVTSAYAADYQLQVNTDANTYELGQTVNITGTVTSDGKQLPGVSVTFQWEFNGGPVALDQKNTDLDGKFTANYVIPNKEENKGKYAVYVSAADKKKKIDFTVGATSTGGVSSGGGGGGSTPTETTTTTSQKVTTSDVNSQITAGKQQVSVKVKDAAEIGSEALKAASDAGKPLVISREDGTASVTVPSGAVNLPAGALLTVSVKQVADSASGNFMIGLEQGMNPAGQTFELNGTVVSGAVSSKVSFEKQVAVTISYADAGIAPGQEDKLGAYWYNEQTKKWDFIGGKVDKVNKTVTFDTDHFSYYSLMVYEKSFSDLAGHWAKQDIELMAARHVAKGTPDGLFNPNQTVTRAQFAAMLSRTMGLKVVAGAAQYFSDVRQSDWYYGEVMAAYTAGIVKGNGSDFLPNDLITREQMAAMTVRALAYKGIKSTLSSEQATAKLSAFSDSSKISGWAAADVAGAVDWQLVRGYPDGGFKPAGNATRAESIVIIKRMSDKI